MLSTYQRGGALKTKDKLRVYYGEQQKIDIKFQESIGIQANKYFVCDHNHANRQCFEL